MEWVFVVLGLLGWAWYSGTVAKEAAVRAARRLCERHQQQLLDETVALRSVRPRRDITGRIGLIRSYSFEFTDDGDRRRHGLLLMLGQRLLTSRLELEEGNLYEDESH